jgi:hypothetical protein
MTDSKIDTLAYLQLGLGEPHDPKATVSRMLPTETTPLKNWLGHEPAPYRYLFAVNITDINPLHLTCEIRRKPATVTSQADLTQAHFDDAIQTGDPIPATGLDLKMNTKVPSLVMLRLNQNGVTFEDPLHSGDSKYVIVRGIRQLHVIFQPRWLTGITDRKAISLVLRGHKTGDREISYALKVRAEAGTAIIYSDIDPKVENEGEERASPRPTAARELSISG